MPRNNSEVLPKVQDDVMEAVFSHSGYGNTAQNTFSMPYLTIVQDSSQVLKKGSPAYDPSVKVGQFYCSALKFSAPTIQVRVVRLDHVVKAWSPSSGAGNYGAPVGTYPVSSLKGMTSKVEKFRSYDSSGNELKETFEYTVLDMDRGDLMIFPMAGTALRPARDWNTRIRSLRIDPKTLKQDSKGRSGLATWIGVWELTPQQNPGGYYNIGSSPRLVKTVDPSDHENIGQIIAYAEEAGQFANSQINASPLSSPHFDIEDGDSANSNNGTFTH